MACCHGLARWIVIHPPGCGYPTTSSTLVTPVLGGTDPQNILQFPINILVYHRSFIAPNLTFLVLSVFFCRKGTMWKLISMKLSIYMETDLISVKSKPKNSI